jgi:hypothetical protein
LELLLLPVGLWGRGSIVSLPPNRRRPVALVNFAAGHRRCPAFRRPIFSVAGPSGEGPARACARGEIRSKILILHDSLSEKQVITGWQNRIGNDFRYRRHLDGKSLGKGCHYTFVVCSGQEPPARADAQATDATG